MSLVELSFLLVYYIRSERIDSLFSSSRLITPFQEVVGKNSKCLRFYYFKRGEDSCSLNIFRTAMNGVESEVLWTRKRDYGDQWNLAELNIETDSNFELVFEALPTNSFWFGTIALDDVSFEDSACPPSGFCDFESTLKTCTWSNVKGLK
jgi:hypothetical protein